MRSCVGAGLAARSRENKKGRPWRDRLRALIQSVDEGASQFFRCCLCNLIHGGTIGTERYRRNRFREAGRGGRGPVWKGGEYQEVGVFREN